jgi:cytoskeletal protein RodZ
MVALFSQAAPLLAQALHPWLLWADVEAKKSLWDRLDPVRRAQLLMALLGLLLLGFLLVTLVLWGGRYVRRLARHNRPTKPLESDRWYGKPLYENTRLRDDDELDESSGDDPP